MPERNRGYLRKQRLRNIERRKKLISQRELMYHGYKTLNDPDFKEGMLHKGHSGRLGMGGTAVKTNTRKGHASYRHKGAYGPADNYSRHDKQQVEDGAQQIKEWEKGYKVLDPHIGIIYGDGCTLNNVKQVWEKLKKKGFAANNIVFGVGAFCFSAVIEPDGYMVVVTRDMFGIAMKATYGIVNGEPIMIYKDPKTDTSHLKKSHKGCCCIYYDDNGELQCEDGYNDVFRDGALSTVFVDGKDCNKETFEDIRERLNGGNKDE